MTKDTSDVVARLLEPVDWAHFVNDDHAADYQAERAEAAALISSLVAENERLQTRLADYQDTHEDEKGNVWHRPTAWAYFAACRALDTEKAPRVEAERLLAEAREALRPWAVIADAVLSEAPHDATKAKLWNGVDNSPLFISLDACRATRASIGGGNG